MIFNKKFYFTVSFNSTIESAFSLLAATSKKTITHPKIKDIIRSFSPLSFHFLRVYARECYICSSCPLCSAAKPKKDAFWNHPGVFFHRLLCLLSISYQFKNELSPSEEWLSFSGLDCSFPSMPKRWLRLALIAVILLV